MSGFNRLIKNSLSNIINGFSNVILGVVISPFLINILSLHDFSIWSLVIQIGAFFTLLSFTCQISVARFVTLARAELNAKKELLVIKYGIYFSLACTLLSVIVLSYVYNNFFSLFNAIKIDESPYAPGVFLIISLSFVFGLIVSVYNGYFTGIERNEIPAIINLISRVFLGVGVCIAASYSMMAMAFTYLTINVVSYLVIYITYLRSKNFIQKNNNLIKEFTFKKFLNYSSGVLVFNLSSFLIINLNGIIVGRYVFNQYAYYALSVTLTTMIVGFINAGLTPVLQPLIKICHSDDKVKLDGFVFILSMSILKLSIFFILGCLIFGKVALDIWIGPDVAMHTYPVFLFLLLVNFSRLIGAPLGLVYLAKGKQNEIMFLPLLEGVTSVLLTFLFVNKYGIYSSSIAIAISTLIIMAIYTFRLIDIAALNTSKIKYRCLFAFGPLIMMSCFYGLIKTKISLHSEIFNISFYMLLTILLIAVSFLLVKEVRKIKSILEG
jgi:O-antigen/teichoic acid export membrane protein